MIECATLAILSPMRCSQASDGPLPGLLGGAVKPAWELLVAVDTGPLPGGTAVRWNRPEAAGDAAPDDDAGPRE